MCNNQFCNRSHKHPRFRTDTQLSYTEKTQSYITIESVPDTNSASHTINEYIHSYIGDTD